MLTHYSLRFLAYIGCTVYSHNGKAQEVRFLHRPLGESFLSRTLGALSLFFFGGVMSFYDNFAAMTTAMLLGLLGAYRSSVFSAVFFLIGMYYALRTFVAADRRK